MRRCLAGLEPISSLVSASAAQVATSRHRVQQVRPPLTRGVHHRLIIRSSVATLRGWQHSRGLDGRNPLDWVATFPWIAWQHSHGLGGRNPWNTHPIDHATIQRWVVKYSPLLEEAFHRRKRPVWVSWRMDETYIKVKGHWYYLYRAVDKTGQTIDCLLTEQRDEHAAKRFLTKAIRRHGVPEKITIDGSAANEAAIKSYNEGLCRKFCSGGHEGAVAPVCVGIKQRGRRTVRPQCGPRLRPRPSAVSS